LGETSRRRASAGRPAWPGAGTRALSRRAAPPAPRRIDLAGWEHRPLAAAWVGHATILLRINGRTILTDPVFSHRIGMGLGLATLGPLRRQAPAIEPAELPPLDLILLSHAHYDHLDRPSLARLPRRTPIVISERNGDLVRDLGFRNITELRWGERFDLPGVRITATPVRHWGARTFFDIHRGYAGYVIESARHRVLYGADTAYHELFKELGRVDLAILGIGAYDPYIAAHASPEQAWDMANHVRADHLLPMHHTTFRLSHEPMTEPLERLLSAAGRGEDRVVAKQVGDQWSIE
jgi:L-ascorbate metabolism protein UlaG (beta-lactamase superfamily)